MRGLWARLFGRSGDKGYYDPASAYLELRNRAFSVTAEKLDLPFGQRVLGVIMETGLPEAVITLVAMGDGSTSLYFSNGGGIIGAGQHKEPLTAVKNLLSEACKYLGQMEATCSYPLPGPGKVRFFALTSDGLHSFEAAEEDLEYEHPFGALYLHSHDVISAIREVEERRQGERRS